MKYHIKDILPVDKIDGKVKDKALEDEYKADPQERKEAKRQAAHNAADLAHQRMIALDPHYAAAVAAGHTTRWSDVYEDEAGPYILLEGKLKQDWGVVEDGES